MTRIRQSVLALAFAVALALSFASPASADPKDGGFTSSSGKTLSPTSDPKDGGFSP